MLRTLDRRGTLPHIVHIHSAPSEKSFLFADELAALAERHADSDDRGYRLHTNLDDRDGIFTLDRLDEVCPDWRERQSWVCGPPPMLEAAEEFWKDNDLEDRLHIERFQPAGFQAGESEAGGTVTFATSNKTAEVDGATTLLEAGEELGIGMPYGCRMGICHTCTLTLVEGRAIDLRNGEQHEGPNTKIQTCVSAVAGNCTLDI
jgi:ferredoxin-NADP reductase